MLYSLLADIVVVLHFTFILFVIFGGLLVLKWRWCAWIHVPMVGWAALVEFLGWYCPLTPVENWLRVRGGLVGYEASFIEHYILPILYPATLTRDLQIALGVFVLCINGVIYAWLIHRSLKNKNTTLRIF